MAKAITPTSVSLPVTSRAFAPTYDAADPNGTESPVLFETNFANDTGYSHAGNGSNSGSAPSGFTGVRCTGNALGQNALECITGGGQSGNALRVRYAADASNPVVNLFRHLSGVEGVGYTDLYTRFVVRFSDTFRAGGINSQAAELGYWKWLRYWANTGTTVGDGWTENRADSNYFYANLTGPAADDYGIPMNAVFSSRDAGSGDKSLGSVGGPRHGLSWYVDEEIGSAAARYGLGRFERPSGLRLSWDPASNAGRWVTTPQTFHTIEMRAFMATDSAPGGFQMWIDGEAQGQPPTINNNGGAPVAAGITTHPEHGAWDMLVAFDNMVHWIRDAQGTGVDWYFDVDSIVCSRAPIGTAYIAGNRGIY